MLLFDGELDSIIMKETRASLQRLEESKQPDLFTHMKQNFDKYDRGRHFYEEYDPISNECKMKVDMLYYNQFFQKLEESSTIGLNDLMISLYKDINQIYEHVNIKPTVYGKDINFETVNAPIQSIQKQLSNIIYEYLDNNFYRLSGDERKKKYYDQSKDDAKSLIQEGIAPEEAISFSIKVAVMENLLTHISFPFAEWSRIKYLCESEDYGAIFDQETLNTLVDSFRTKIHNISKVVAACV